MTGPAKPRQAVLMINSLGIGGAQIQLAHLLRGLVAAGWSVRLYTLLPPPDPSPVLSEVLETGTPVHVLGSDGASPFASARRTVQLLREHQPELLVSFLYQANVLARIAGRLAGVPAVVTSIRNERFGGRGRDAVIRLTGPLATLTTANSHGAARALTDRGVVPSDGIHVVRNAVVAERRTAASRQRARTALELTDEFVWLAVGRMTPQKSYATLLAAFARCASERPRMRLWIAGDGPDRQRMEQLATDLGVRPHVRFLGFRTDVPQLLQAADGFVLSSRWEGSPNVVLEAMAVGVPVVATDVGGVSELLARPGTGVMVPPESVPELARGMQHVVELSAAQRQDVTHAAWRVVEELHGVEPVIARWLEVLETACTSAGAHDHATRTRSRAMPAVRSGR